jgi:hypothetical protein
MSRRSRLVVIILVVAAGLVCWQRQHRAGVEAKQQLLSYRAALRLGLTLEDSIGLFTRGGYSDLTLVQRDSDSLIVQTPISFGASNWHLYLQYKSNRLVAIHVRLADNANIRPGDGPTDISDGLMGEDVPKRP